MAEPPASAPGSLGLWKSVGSTIASLFHKVTGVEQLTRRIDELEKSSKERSSEIKADLKEKTGILVTDLARASDDIKVLGQRIANLEGQFAQFTKIVDMVAKDIDKTDAMIAGKVKNEVWAEVQELTRFRNEIEQKLAELKNEVDIDEEKV
jgi:hypothetical protein